MAGDYSRDSFVKDRHYSGVLIQQGRVFIDADWNEQWEIEQYRTMTETTDVIGPSGVPKKGGGFKIGVTASEDDLTISPGRIYVGGLLCELEKTHLPTTYLNQPYYPDPDTSDFNIVPFSAAPAPASPPDGALSSPVTGPVNVLSSPPASPPSSPPSSPPATSGLKDGTYLVYLDAWQQEINFHDDPHIHEVALGEADTATRMQNVWQVKLWQVPAASSANATCKTSFPGWDQLIAPPTGRMNARVITPANPTNPCQLPPTSGYRGLENQLYRVEVQNGGTAATATIKWSRDNGTVESIITGIDNMTITVPDLGRDNASLGFAYGQWVEIVDEESTLQQSPNPLVTIQKITPGPDGFQILVSAPVGQYDGLPGLKLRRWDQSTNASQNGVNMTSGGWLGLENGIQVSFREGTYNAGDYWLIPARTATGEIEWPPYPAEWPNNSATGADPVANPMPQAPKGVRHYYCRLSLLEVSGGVVTPQDCRHKFPALTEIDASDVRFNNSTCNLAGAANVQEALDLLCTANQMRDHNKYLHGYGVVCGLKVVCGYQRQTVTIQSGYAIDCDGNVIKVQGSGTTYSIVEESRQYLHDGNGAVCLILNSGTGTPTFSVEKYVKKSFWEEVLEGTLLKDFYDDSVGKLLAFVMTEFGSMTPTAPVPIGQRRLTSLLNLLSQVLNSASGPYAFLSGVQGPRNTTDCSGSITGITYEDQLLYCLYKDLRNLLASQTFCGMFDGDRKFPDYTIAPGLGTIFGPPIQLHTRLQISPDGKYAYTCGQSNTVYMYDLGSQQLLNILTFPASATIILRDIAISSDGTELVVMGILNNLDTYFAVATIATGGTYTWGSTSVVCGTLYGRIAFSPPSPYVESAGGSAPPASGLLLYGTVLTKGFYQIKGIGTSSFATSQVGPTFNATGIFTFSDSGGEYVYAAAATASGVQTNFNQVIAFGATSTTPLGSGSTAYAFTGLDAENDLLCYNGALFITGNNPGGASSKVIGWIRNIDPTAGANYFQIAPLSDNSITRLAGVNYGGSNFLLVSMSDKCKVERYSINWLGGETAFVNNFRIPTQVYPMQIAVSADGTMGYALNMIVNTLTTINFSQVFNPSSLPDYTIDPPSVTDSIRTYRGEVLDAYHDLFNHLLQFFKDSFCDRFLIDCPDCTGKEKIYLGCVEIRKGRVYKICNFRKRKYVKTFRTVGYWLSTIPVMPLIKESFTKFCCSVASVGTNTVKNAK